MRLLDWLKIRFMYSCLSLFLDEERGALKKYFSVLSKNVTKYYEILRFSLKVASL